MLQLLVTIQVLALDVGARARRRLAEDRGQSTAEYALVLLGAAAVAMLLVAWATKTNRVTRLFDGVVDKVLEQVS